MKIRQAAPAPTNNRAKTLGIASIVTFLALAGLMVIPAPFVIKTPGPTYDTLGEANSQDLITVTDAESFDSTGELRLTTVGVNGGPGYPINFAQVVRGWLDKTSVVVPRESVFPEDVSQEEVDAMNQAEMATSQEQATYAALKLLDQDVTTVLNVQMAMEGSPFAGVLEPDDVLVAIDGTPIGSYEDLIAHMDKVPAGTEVTLTYKDASNGNKESEAKGITLPNEGGEGSRLGIALHLDFDFPVDVAIRIDRIGGPSAGMMFALGIIERLTPGDQTDGQIIAGTGTMDTSGAVGPIGGIQQKLAGSLRDGATHFLAPLSNCDEVVGHVPEGLQVVAVATLDQAWDAVEKIGAGDGADLPTCEAK